MRASGAVAVSILVSAVAGAAHQQPASHFRVGVEVVRVDALVTSRGRPVSGLLAGEFELFDNGIRQVVESVTVEAVPVNVVLALDLSASMAGERLVSLLAASRAGVEALRPIDRASIVTFSHEIVERVAPTADRNRLYEGLSQLSAGGDTSLYDAAYSCLLLPSAGQSGTLLLLFSDGGDTSSWLQPSAVIESALRSDVVIYAVAADHAGKSRPVDALMRQPGRRWKSGEAGRLARVDEFLLRVTEATGGRLLRAEDRNLAKSFADAVREFQNRYLLTYTAKGVENRGWHNITLRVNRRDVEVKARRGYWR